MTASKGRVRVWAFAAATAMPALAWAQGNVVLTPEEQGFTVSTPLYTARILADGSLHSLKVKDVELLDDAVGDSAGVYLFANGPVQFARVEMLDAGTLRATGEDAELTYKFTQNAITIEAEQSRSALGYVFLVLSEEIERANNLSGPGSVKGIANGWWRVVRFVAKSGPVLHVGGLTRVSGPWPDAKNPRQRCQANVAEGQTRTVRLAVAAAPAPADLVSLRMGCPEPDFIFARGETPSVTVEVVNDGKAFETMLTCTLMTFRHKALSAQARRVRVEAGESTTVAFELAKATEPGFYDVSADFRHGKYAVRKELVTVGVAPEELRPPLYRQPDFEEFWARTLSEARAVAMDARVTPAPDRSNEQVQTYKVNFAGLGGSRWYGWYCVPKGAGTYPAVVVFPGYGDRALAPPVGWARRGYAGLVIQVREHDVDLPEYEGKRYMVEGVESKEAYVFRRIYAACVRCVDFLCGRAEVAHDKIAVTGASQGGGLSLVTAALDPRVKLCMADVPFLSNYPAAVPVAGYPYREIRDYIEKHPDRREEVFEVLSYFDAMNFAPDIKCPVLMSVGLRDRTCPPAAVYGVFNHIASRKGIHVYPRLGHAVAPEQWPIKYRWMAELSGPAPAAGE